MSTQSREIRDRGRLLGRVSTLRDIHEEVAAKKALADAEARYRLLAENANDLVLAGDNQGRINWVSDSVNEVLGWQPVELVGTTFRHVVHPDDLAMVADIQKGLLAGKPGRGRLRLRTAHGEFRWFDGLARSVFDDEGNVIGRVSGWRDVQDEQVALDELRASEERYRLIVENVGDVVIRTDSDHRITWASPSLPQNSGWQVEEVLGRSVWDYIHPDDWHGMQVSLSDVPDGAVGKAEVRLRYHDGSYQYWAIHPRLVKEPSADTALIVTLRNVNAEVNARLIAQREARRRQAILDSTMDPHVLLEAVRDASGAIVDFIFAEANDAACAYNLMPRQGLVGKSLLELFPAHTGTGLLDLYRHTVNTGEPLILDDYVYPHEILAERRHFDIRGVRVGDALSYTWRDVTERAENQARLAESERRYRTLVEQSVDVIVTADSDGLITFVSPALSSLLGWQPETLVGQPLSVLVHQDDRPAIADARRVLLEEGRGRYRARFEHADGTFTWVETNAALVRDADGAVEGVSELWRDVHTEVRARQAAEEEATRRAAVLDSMLDPHVLLQAVRDESGAIVDFIFAEANDAACSYNQMPRDQLVGATIMQLLPGHAGSGLFELYCHTVNTGEPLILDDYVYPHEILAEPRHFDIRGVRVGDALSFSWRDVTERAESQTLLAASEANYRTLVERMAHVTLATDPDGVITYTSEAVADLLGYGPSELLGLKVFDLVHPVERGAAAAFRAHLVATGAGRSRGRLRCKDGTYRWVEASGQTQQGPDGSITGIIGQWRDATSDNDSEVIAEHIGDPVLRLAGDGMVTWISPSVPRQLGGAQMRWLGLTLRDRVEPEDLATFDQIVSRVAVGQHATGRMRLTGLDENRHWVDATFTATDQAGVLVVSLHIVDDDVAREQTLKRISELDTLTGLSNRRDLLMRLTAILSKRRKGDRTGLLFCDIDNLKQINDAQGHAAGDTVISTVAQRIQHLVRRDDICARFGGDEFVIVLLGLHRMAEAEMIAEKIRAAASLPVALPGKASIAPSLSIGVTLARPDEEAADLLERADIAMYRAKDAGRDSVSVVE